MHHAPLSAYVLSKLEKEGGSKGNGKEGGRGREGRNRQWKFYEDKGLCFVHC